MKFAYFNPTVIAVEEVPADTFVALQDMVWQAHQKENLNDAGNPEISVRGGQQIQLVPNQFNMNTDALKVFVEKSCKEYISNVIRATGRDDLDPYDPELVSAWTIRQQSGDYQTLHRHEAHISGNIYIETPDLDFDSNKSDSCLEFRLPVIRNPAHFIFTDNWQFKPKNMNMVIFPSYLPHTVYPWKGQGHRTILAWDVKLVAKNS